MSETATDPATGRMMETVERIARVMALCAGQKLGDDGRSAAYRESPDGGVYLNCMEIYIGRHWNEYVHAAKMVIQAMQGGAAVGTVPQQ